MKDAPIRVLHVVDGTARAGVPLLVRRLAAHATVGHEMHLLLLEGTVQGIDQGADQGTDQGTDGTAEEPLGGPVDGPVEEPVSEPEPAPEPFFASTVRQPASGPSWRVDRLNRDVSTAVGAIGADVVHAHSLRAALAITAGRRRDGARRVATLPAPEPSDVDRWGPRLQARLGGLFSSRLDAVVADGEQARAYLRRHGWSDRYASTIGSGVPIVDDPLLGPRPRRLLSLAPWTPSKDYPTLFAAFREVRRLLPDVRLACAGAGMDVGNADLVDLVDAHSLKRSVDLIGEIDDVTGELEASVALVIASASGEDLPMAGLEAIASGTPVLTTDVGRSARLAVKDFQLVAPREPKALAGAIRYLLSLPALEYDRLVLLSHQHARDEFDFERTVTAYDDLYRGVLSRR